MRTVWGLEAHLGLDIAQIKGFKSYMKGKTSWLCKMVWCETVTQEWEEGSSKISHHLPDSYFGTDNFFVLWVSLDFIPQIVITKHADDRLHYSIVGCYGIFCNSILVRRGHVAYLGIGIPRKMQVSFSSSSKPDSEIFERCSREAPSQCFDVCLLEVKPSL